MALTKLFVEPWRERALAAAGLVGALVLVTVGTGAPSAQRGPVRFEVTVVPSDETNLDCASDAAVGGRRCAFTAKGEPAAEVSRPWRPYTSTHGELLLISGAFETPDVAKWLETARRRGSNRVVLRCRGRWLGHAARVGIRMRRTDAFVTHRNVPTVLAEQCSVKP